MLSHQQKSHLVINMIDDFHVISSPKQPLDLKKSTSIDMMTSLLDIPSVASIPRPQDSLSIHRTVQIKVQKETKDCRGGISHDDVVMLVDKFLDCSCTFLEGLPEKYKSITPQSVESQIKELGYVHVYVHVMQSA